MTAAIRLIRKPGTISYSSKSNLCQTRTVTAPEIIPAMAPQFVSFLQYKLKTTIGPNEAPNPDLELDN